MALTTVYYEGPTTQTGVPAWVQVLTAPEARYATLDLASDATGLFWRGVYSSNLWIDPNHIDPGAGYCGLMAVASNGTRGGASAVIGDQPYNLTGGRFSVDIRANVAGGGLRIGQNVRLVYWIQFRDPTANHGEGRYVNLAYIGQTVDRLLGFTVPFERAATELVTSDWVTLTVPFDPSQEADWLHYGSRTEKLHIYEQDTDHEPNSLDRVFRYWDVGMGIHAFYGRTKPKVVDFPLGHLNFRNFRLEVDPVLNGLPHG